MSNFWTSFARVIAGCRIRRARIVRSGDLLPPSPPAEKAAASKDQGWASQHRQRGRFGIARDLRSLTAYNAGSDFWVRRVLRCFFARGQSPL
jgi:hypothetical protein